jgi:glucose-1-phosphate cytidylyltransferase
MANNTMQVHHQYSEPWKVTLVDTGEQTMTGGRLRRVASYLKDESEFCFTYGDGVSDVSITELIRFHRNHGQLATLTSVHPPGRFGIMKLDGKQNVTSFKEKPEGEDGLVNGGFFVLSPKVLELIEGDDSVWERGPLETLAELRQLRAYVHDGFWQPMDTLRDKNFLEELWANGRAPWKVWK